jgi:histidyl-tRNA synthetase
MKANMSQNTQSYKGTRDFYPEDKRLQKWMFSVIRSAVEKFGYEEYDAPVLESTELFKMKGSEEIIDDQSYTFEDRGGRSVTLRTEMTPSVSRMVAAKRQELAYPLRWYSIPNLWRYERPQRGRLREFWQLNVDIFGVEGLEADFEIIQIADAVMQAFKAKRVSYTIKLNSRAFVDELLTRYIGLDGVETSTIRRLIDKRSKLEPAEFVASVDAAMNPTQRESGASDKLLAVLDAKSIDELPEGLKNSANLVKLKQLIEQLKTVGMTNIEFDVSLMRGFDYYTDIVFEVFDENPENNRSMFGGGRYDGLVGLFGVEPVPTVGFGMGDVTLENFLRANDLIPKLTVETELYVALIGDVVMDAQKLVTKLREEGVNVAVDMSVRKLGKQIETAVKKGIQYLLVIGEEELKTNQFKLKDLATGVEEVRSLERIVSIVRARDDKTLLD